jgi:hypothetical protein
LRLSLNDCALASLVLVSKIFLIDYMVAGEALTAAITLQIQLTNIVEISG